MACCPHLWVLSFFSRALACCSLTITALTWGGFMWTFSFPPTRRRTVAANLVWVFNTWGGCFSMMKVLRIEKRGQWWVGSTFPWWGDLSYPKSVIFTYGQKLNVWTQWMSASFDGFISKCRSFSPQRPVRLGICEHSNRVWMLDKPAGWDCQERVVTEYHIWILLSHYRLKWKQFIIQWICEQIKELFI